MQTSTPYYSVGDMSSFARPAVGAKGTYDTRLRGVLCACAQDGVAAARAGADFLVMQEALADGELAALCDLVPVPVYASGIAVEQAWVLGASGLNEIRA